MSADARLDASAAAASSTAPEPKAGALQSSHASHGSTRDVAAKAAKVADLLRRARNAEAAASVKGCRRTWARATVGDLNYLVREGHSSGRLEEADMPLVRDKCGASDNATTFTAGWLREAADPGAANISTVVRLLYRQTRDLLLASLIFGAFDIILPFVGPFVLQMLVRRLEEHSAAVLAADHEPTAIEPAEAMTVTEGVIFVVALFFAPALASMSEAAMLRRAQEAGVRVQGALSGAVFRKALRLAATDASDTSVGQIINLLTVDTQHIVQITTQLNILWTSPIKLILALVYLWTVIGPFAFAGIAALLLLLPLFGCVAGRMSKLWGVKMQIADERMKVTSELINAVRVIKCFAWEDKFTDKVEAVRDRELEVVRSMSVTQVVAVTFIVLSPLLSSLATFAAYSLAGNTLTPSTVFTSLSLFLIMRIPLMELPQVAGQVLNSRVSLRRLVAFLGRPEMKLRSSLPAPRPPADGDGGEGEAYAVMRDAEFDWGTTADGDDAKGNETDGGTESKAEAGAGAGVAQPTAATLRGISVRFRKGALTMIVGSVGSGKSSLLAALLAEIAHTKGTLEVAAGPSAYVPQSAFIMNATVKQNILFGLKFDEGAFSRTVAACALADDFKVLPAGEETEIGEKGINVSGGQKQRIAIARVVYRRLAGSAGSGLQGGFGPGAAAYLFDDPLSAVDVHVGRHLFEKVLVGELTGETRVLVTNQLQYLPYADHIVLVDRGAVVDQGTHADMVARGVKFDELITEEESGESESEGSSSGSEGSDVEAEANDDAGEGGDAGALATAAADAVGQGERKSDNNAAGALVSADDVAVETDKPAGERTRTTSSGSAGEGGDRTRARSHSSGRRRRRASSAGSDGRHRTRSRTHSHDGADNTKKKSGGDGQDADGQLVEEESRAVGRVGLDVYRTYVKSFGGFGLLACVILFFMTVQLTVTGSDVWLSWWSQASHEDPDGTSVSFYLGIYATLAAVNVVVSLTKGVVYAQGSVNASRALHSRLLRRVLRAPVAWFDTVPSGRILNRFATDMAEVDMELPELQNTYITIIFSLLAYVATLGVLLPWFLLVLPPVAYVYVKVQAYYRTAAIELQRLEAVTRSPMYQCFGESLHGSATIRAFGLASHFTGVMDGRVDIFNQVNQTNFIATLWLNVRLATLSSIVIFSIGSILVGTALSGDVTTAGTAGLALSYSFELVFMAGFVVMIGTFYESRLNAVQRVTEFSEVASEAPLDLPSDADPGVMPADWPAKGEIVISDVHMRYRPNLPLVLKGLSVTFPAGSKVGIVGRTGAGKSSLVTALLRLTEVTSGRISVDGVDTKDVGLRRLRTGVELIPQDPTLFAGTVRSNLDLFNEREDADVWEALRRVHLDESVGRWAKRGEDKENEAGTDGADKAGKEGKATGKAPGASTSSARRGGRARDTDATPAAGGDTVSQSNPLEAYIAPGGGNLSTGERQLMCLARALLRRPKVLVMDESTASVDSATDRLLQETVRSVFAQATTLIIAHRLVTIADCDYVLVMADGKVAEFGSPAELLGLDVPGTATPREAGGTGVTGAFASMVKDSGEEEALREMARKAAESGGGWGAGATSPGGAAAAPSAAGRGADADANAAVSGT